MMWCTTLEIKCLCWSHPPLQCSHPGHNVAGWYRCGRRPEHCSHSICARPAPSTLTPLSLIERNRKIIDEVSHSGRYLLHLSGFVWQGWGSIRAFIGPSLHWKNISTSFYCLSTYQINDQLQIWGFLQFLSLSSTSYSASLSYRKQPRFTFKLNMKNEDLYKEV